MSLTAFSLLPTFLMYAFSNSDIVNSVSVNLPTTIRECSGEHEINNSVEMKIIKMNLMNISASPLIKQDKN